MLLSPLSGAMQDVQEQPCCNRLPLDRAVCWKTSGRDESSGEARTSLLAQI